MEIMFLAEKNRISIDLNSTIDYIENSDAFTICNLVAEIIRVAEKVTFYEIHDRLLLATAKYLSIPIISSDSKFQQVSDIETIWD
jgi:predicted nucleic acid-binding protein